MERLSEKNGMFANGLGCTQSGSTRLPTSVNPCRHPNGEETNPYEQFVEYDRLTEAKIQALLKENARLRRALGETGGNAQHTKLESAEQKQPPEIQRTQAFMYTLQV